MTLMTHDIRDISGRPYLGGQHGVSRIARGRFSHSERPFHEGQEAVSRVAKRRFSDRPTAKGTLSKLLRLGKKRNPFLSFALNFS